MRRLTRPLGYTAFALTALWGFTRLRAATPTPLDWAHPSDWLDRVSATDALIELSRWAGIGLAAYVAFVAVLALIIEFATFARAVPIERAARFVGRLIAVPALRRRLLDASTAAAITVASLNIAVPGATAAPAPIAQQHEEVSAASPALAFSLPPTLDESMFRGFGYAAPFTPVDLPTATSDDGTSSVVVLAGDTLWEIATEHYGFCDNDLIRFVQTANPDMADPGLIYTGQTIVLPELFPSATAAAPPVAEGDATWSVHVIVRGDTLWDVLQHHYGHVDADLIWRIAEINGLENPSDIPIGTTITLRPLGEDTPATQPAATIPAGEAPAPAEESDAGPAAPEGSPPVDDAVEATTTPVEDDQVGVNANAEPIAIPSPAPAEETEATAPAVASADSETDGVLASLAHRIGWQGSAALAAGMIALAAQLRRERRHRSERPPTEPVRDVDLVMRTAPVASNVEWAAETLRGLASQLRPRAGQPFPTPLGVQLDDDGMEVLWTEPRPHLVEGWTTPNDGRSWHRSRDLSPVDTTVTAPCPALVTIGTHDGAQVLLNLEVPGVLAITGDRNAALDTARAICLELGSTHFKDVTNSLLCAFPLDGIEHLEWVQAVTADEAAHWLHERRESALAQLADSRLGSLFALRSSRSKHDPHSPVVVIVDTEQSTVDDVQRLAELADPSTGAVVITIGRTAIGGAWSLDCTAASTTLDNLGLTLAPVAVSVSMSSTIATFLDYAAGEDVNTGDLPDRATADGPGLSEKESEAAGDNSDVVPAVRVIRERPDSDAHASCDETPGIESSVEPQPPVVVFRILGPVGVDGLDVPLRPTELELGIYLALHRHGQTADTIRTMIWPNGSADKTWRNVSSSLRTKLGCDPDGTHRLSSRGNLGRYFLTPSVTTDLELLITRVNAAKDLCGEDLATEACAAFELIRGPLFSDTPTGYSWAYSEGTTSRIELDLARLTSDLAGRLRQCGLTADAERLGIQAGPVSGGRLDSHP